MQKIAIFSMDVEEWYDADCLLDKQVDKSLSTLDGFDKYKSLLDKYEVKCTFFVLSELLPKREKEFASALKQGHKIALHGFNHIIPTAKTIEEFSKEIDEAKKSIQQALNVEIRGYRAPCFSIDQDRLNILKNSGFCYDSSDLEFKHQIHHVDLKLQGNDIYDGITANNGFYEFPISIGKFCGKKMPISGGGYLRLIPWWACRIALNRYLNRHNYYLFYVHPFELSNQKLPRIKHLSFLKRCYMTIGRDKYLARIEKIINLLKKKGYEFTTFDDFVGHGCQ